VQDTETIRVGYFARKPKLLIWIFCALLLIVSDHFVAEAEAASAQQSHGKIESQPLNTPGTSGGEYLFELMDTEQTGIDFVHEWNPSEKYKREIAYSTAGGGVCIGDYDNDGLPDIFQTRPHGDSRLHRNLGGFRFEDVYCFRLSFPVFILSECESFLSAGFVIPVNISSAFGKSFCTPV
jgi:hypothetical protein